MIRDHLERYYEAHGRENEHVILRSVMIDGHEVAWVELRDQEPLPEGRRPFRQMRCECDYIEGTGWCVMKDGGVATIGGQEPCVHAEAALRLRHLELRQEYAQIFDRRNIAGLTEEQVQTAVLGLSSQEALCHIILDLVTKAKAGEWLEQGTGALFWGGYYYVQTVQAITDAPWETVWEVVRALAAEGQISLEGAVVQDYREPDAPEWTEYGRFTEDGWTGIALMPAHGDMPQEWKLQVLRPDGSVAVEDERLSMTYTPTFGPDIGDVAASEARLLELIAKMQRFDLDNMNG
jgi:hypothetical protein